MIELTLGGYFFFSHVCRGFVCGSKGRGVEWSVGRKGGLVVVI